MKKLFAILSAALSVSVSSAQTDEVPQPITEPEPTAAAPAAEPAVTRPHPGAAHLEPALEFAMTCEELATLLQPVTDWSTANKAAPQAEIIVNRLAAILDKMAQLPPPTPEIEQYVAEQLSKLDSADIAERSLGKVIDLLTQVDPPCYGARDLTEPLQRLAELLMGGV